MLTDEQKRDPVAHWHEIVPIIRAARPTLSGSLAHMRPSVEANGALVLTGDSGFDVCVINAEPTLAYLSGIFGRQVIARRTQA